MKNAIKRLWERNADAILNTAFVLTVWIGALVLTEMVPV